MADDARHRGLGRGLSALLGDGDPAAPATPQQQKNIRTLPIAFLKPNRFQPRKTFGEEELRDLASSIREKGILQPIVVRQSGADSYEIVAGERRWRAAQLAKLHEVPVSVREFSDAEALEIAIIENVQRADLNAIEEAAAYSELMAKFSYTQEKLAEVIGKSRPHIANTLRLLKLPDQVRKWVAEGQLSAGHARTLIGQEDAEARAKAIIGGGLNVRQAESRKRVPSGKAAAAKPTKDSDTKALERSVSNALGLNVTIDHKGDKGGQVVIKYIDLEQLDEICHRLSTHIEID